MFNDEDSIAFKKMLEYSTVDGFVEITESLAEMIKFVANEPSVGLFYIQQHTQNAVPNLINLENNVSEKSHELTLHTEDSEDSITMMRSMKQCGLEIADEMIRDIKKSLAVMSSKQPKRGLISSSSWSPAMWNRSTSYRQRDGEKSDGGAGYFSNVFKSAKQKASNIKWPQLDPSEPNQTHGKTVLHPDLTSLVAAANSSTISVSVGEDLPSSSQIVDVPQELPVDRSMSQHELVSFAENFEEFKAVREAKLEEWLGGTEDEDLNKAINH